MRRFTVAATVIVVAATICTSQQTKTGFGEWQYLEQASALETAKWLLLYGQTEEGTTWIIGRRCDSDHRVLMAHAASQGAAADLGVVVRRRDCVVNWSTTSGCDQYADTTRYKTRYRVDDNEISWVNWYYGYDSNAGIETLSVMRYSSRSQGFIPVNPEIIDRMVSGDRLAIEISSSRGVATFNTTGYADTVAGYCQAGGG